MKIIVGLGNPGEQYKNTRHNAGFLALDSLGNSKALNHTPELIRFSLDKKLKSRIYHTVHKGEKIILVKPDTFMNASGAAVSLVMQYYKAKIDDLVVLSDDVDLPLGQLRVRLRGGSGGQKGLQNIIDTLGTEEFVRVRIGIANTEDSNEIDLLPTKIDTADYVLQNFSNDEMAKLEKTLETLVSHITNTLNKKLPWEATSLENN